MRELEGPLLERRPDKAWAWDVVRRARRVGTIHRVDTCEDCHQRPTACSHHEDYSKPLDVVWLCCICHKARHEQAVIRRPRLVS